MVRQVFDDAARERLVATVASTLGTVQPELRTKVYDYWRSIDKATGDAVADMVEGGREPADVGPAPASDEPETVVAQA